MPKTKISIELPEPHDAQAQILDHPARFKVVNCGRRFGKTQLGILGIIPLALTANTAWAAPTYKVLMDGWREIKRVTKDLIARKDETEKRIEFKTGGSITFWTLDNYESIRGRAYTRFVWDECASTHNGLEIWSAVIEPTLIDYEGDAWFLSTPKGHNHFWQFYGRGLDSERYPDWSSWQMPTTANPYMKPAEIERIKREAPAHYFQQEYLAEFLSDNGMVFRGVEAVATLQPAEPVRNEQYVMGIDWGRMNDFTAVAVIDSQGRQVYLDRFNQVSWSLQRDRVLALAERYKPGLVLAEANSIGEPNIEELAKVGLRVRPFQTTSASKQPLIDDLAAAIEKQAITLLDDPVQTAELQSYEMKRTPSGRWQFSAPDGGHDDTVIALALAWRAASTPKARARKGTLYG